MSTFQNKPASNKETCQRTRPINNMAPRKRIPEETKVSVQALRTTTNLTLTEIAELCKVSIATVHRTITAKDKVPGNKRHLCSRKRKLTPEDEALVLGSIAEEGSLIRELHVSHIKSSAIECGEQSIVFLAS